MQQSDVFISYRRKDVDFTKQIVNALKETGRELWIDWEDIPPGAEGFTDEIQLGIENSNAMVVILSPSYIESEYCLMELREALRLKKRIIPVVHQKFEPTPPPEGIGHINWVYFTPHAGQENTFEESFPKVIQALEADYAHAREHTRLLTRAIDWDKHAHAKGYLLTGEEIDAAEGWQVQAASKTPSPTELQLDYVLTSRKYQREQQRRFTIAIGVLMVLAVVAAIYAVIQANAARIGKEIAHSNALAAGALQPGNEEVAIALALEATRSEYAPQNVYDSLARVVYPAGGIRYWMATDRVPYPFLSPAIHPDGKHIVIQDTMFDLKTYEAVQTFEPGPGLPLTGIFTADGKRLIIAGDDEGYNDPSADPIFLALYDVESGKLIRTFDTGIGISQVQLSADEKTLIAYQPDGKVVWWDVASGKQKRVFEGDAYDAPAFSPDLKWMAQIRRLPDDPANAELDLINTQTMQVSHTITGFAGAGSLLFSNDSKEITLLSTELESYDVETGVYLRAYHGAYGLVNVRYSPDGATLVTTSADRTLSIWARNTGELIKRLTAHHSPLIFADYAEGGKSIVSMDSSGVVIAWDVYPGNMANIIAQDPDTFSTIHGITPDGKYTITSENSIVDFSLESLTIRDTQTFKEVSHLSFEKTDGISAIYLAEGLEKALLCYTRSILAPDGSVASSEIIIANLQTGEVKQKWSVDSKDISYFNSIQFGPNAKELYVQYTRYAEDFTALNTLETWDIASGEFVTTYLVDEPIQSVIYALNPNGTRLVLATETSDADGNTIALTELIDIATGNVIATIDQQVTASILFTNDGTQFMLVSRDSFGETKSHISIHNAEDGAVVNQYTIPVDAQAQFQLDPQNKTFVTSFSGGGGGGGGPGTPSGIVLSGGIIINPFTKVWDFSSGQQIWEYPIPGSPSFFTPDGKYLLSNTGSGLIFWRIDSNEDLIAWACANRYVPGFNDKQREQFRIEYETSICADTDK